MKKFMPFKHIEILLTIIYLLLFCSCALPPVEYKYTEIFPEGWRSISIVAMNNNKEVIGKGIDSNGARKTFFYSNGIFTELRALEGWDDNIEVVTINNDGEVLGNGYMLAGSGGYVYKSFIYSNGHYTEILPEWSSVVTYDINDNKEVLGSGFDPDGLKKTFIYRNGLYQEIPPPRLEGDFHCDVINNNGDVGGRFFVWGMGIVSEIERVFIYKNGKYVMLPKPLGYRKENNLAKIRDLNNKGDFILWLDKTGGKNFWTSFLYSNGRYKEMHPPESKDSINCLANAINNNREVTASGEEKSFIYYHGKYREVTPPAGWGHVGLADINDYGEITGILSNDNGFHKGFIAIPVTK
jgi:hypothetical protein